MVNEFYKKAVKKVQKVQASNEHEESIKNQFIKQLVEFKFQIKVEYPQEYGDFVEKIEDKLRKLITPHDADLTDDLKIIKYYKLKIVKDISDYYNYMSIMYSRLDD
jgi:hypothetical protein